MIPRTKFSRQLKLFKYLAKHFKNNKLNNDISSWQHTLQLNISSSYLPSVAKGFVTSPYGKTLIFQTPKLDSFKFNNRSSQAAKQKIVFFTSWSSHAHSVMLDSIVEVTSNRYKHVTKKKQVKVTLCDQHFNDGLWTKT